VVVPDLQPLDDVLPVVAESLAITCVMDIHESFDYIILIFDHPSSCVKILVECLDDVSFALRVGDE
jgi:hypothetical protein